VSAATGTVQETALDELRIAFGEMLGAERRLRGRDQQRDSKLTFAHVRALLMLADCEEATAGQLARAAELNPASVTGMLDHLEREGIVNRRRSDRDRRSVLVSLTASGRELLEAKRERWRSMWREHLEGFPPEDLAAAARVLRGISGLLDEL
jgi:MarR family transcriptional regulator, organic hydroperoxide resistance regulator